MTTHRLFLTLAAALVPVAAFAQPEMPFAPMPAQEPLNYHGYEVFHWLLHRADVKPVMESDLRERQFKTNLKDTIVIVLGSPHHGFPGQSTTQSWIDGALSNNGAVLVACDQAVSMRLNCFSNTTLVQFTGERVSAFPPAGRFQNNPKSPFVESLAEPHQTAPEWKLFGGENPLTRVATEVPGVITEPLRNVRGEPLALAGFPIGCVIGNQFNNRQVDGFVFAVGKSGLHPNTGRPFRFLALGDQAVFINGLMVSEDAAGPTDNMEFADRVVTYLTEENGVKTRTKCLLIENGRVVEKFDDLNRLLRPPMPLPKLPPWDQLQPKLVDFGNQILDKVQENDIPNKLMVRSDPDRPGSWFRSLLTVLLVAATLWAVVALVRRVWGARAPTDLAPSPPDGRPPPPPDGRAGVFGRRGKELATRDNLLEPARAACRDLFDTIGGPPDPGPRLPKVVISDIVRRPETLRQALRDLWAVAYGRPTPVTAMRWAVLAPLIPRALAAHRDGKWRFVESEAWADVSTRPRGEA